jgi:hypothetical protein
MMKSEEERLATPKILLESHKNMAELLKIVLEQIE